MYLLSTEETHCTRFQVWEVETPSSEFIKCLPAREGGGHVLEAAGMEAEVWSRLLRPTVVSKNQRRGGPRELLVTVHVPRTQVEQEEPFTAHSPLSGEKPPWLTGEEFWVQWIGSTFRLILTQQHPSSGLQSRRRLKRLVNHSLVNTS